MIAKAILFFFEKHVQTLVCNRKIRPNLKQFLMHFNVFGKENKKEMTSSFQLLRIV